MENIKHGRMSGPKREDTIDVAEPCTLRSCMNCTVLFTDIIRIMK